MWQCKWHWEVKINVSLEDFLSTLEIVEPINPPDAFFGGRTEAFRLCAHVYETEGEHFEYDDFASLYPDYNKNGTYPVVIIPG